MISFFPGQDSSGYAFAFDVKHGGSVGGREYAFAFDVKHSGSVGSTAAASDGWQLELDTATRTVGAQCFGFGVSATQTALGACGWSPVAGQICPRADALAAGAWQSGALAACGWSSAALCACGWSGNAGLLP